MSIKTMMGLMAMTLLLQACGDKQQTVDWYQDHDAERKEKVAWCNNDAGRSTSADCRNAVQADELHNLTKGKRSLDGKKSFLK